MDDKRQTNDLEHDGTANTPQSAFHTPQSLGPFFYPAGETGCLLLHGLSSSPFTLREMGAHLVAQGITVAAPLLAGHGTSPEDLRTKGL